MELDELIQKLGSGEYCVANTIELKEALLSVAIHVKALKQKVFEIDALIQHEERLRSDKTLAKPSRAVGRKLVGSKNQYTVGDVVIIKESGKKGVIACVASDKVQIRFDGTSYRRWVSKNKVEWATREE